MRDKGPRRSITMRRSRFYLLLVFFGCLPFLCALLSIQCWRLWEENQRLRENVQNYEAECQKAVARAERLENLEELLDERNVPARELLIRQLARQDASRNPDRLDTTPVEGAEGQASPVAEGPGHEEFPVLETERLVVGNIQARAQRGHTLRVGLDLRNPQPDQMLSGHLSITLLTADGARVPLNISPADAGTFKISRFKHTVMTARVPAEASLVDSQIIIEARDQDGGELYRNVFDVQH